MKTMTVAEFKTHFSEVIDQVKAGEQIEVTFGKSKEVVGYFVSDIEYQHSSRKLGLLEGKAKVGFNDNFKISEDDFLGL